MCGILIVCSRSITCVTCRARSAVESLPDLDSNIEYKAKTKNADNADIENADVGNMLTWFWRTGSNTTSYSRDGHPRCAIRVVLVILDFLKPSAPPDTSKNIWIPFP